MSNITEDFDRGSDREFIQFLRIATGSSSELKSQLYAALNQKYITDELFSEIYQKAIEVTKSNSWLYKIPEERQLDIGLWTLF